MKKEYLEEVKNYIHKNGKLNSEFCSYSKIYSMTTENIAGFLNNYDLKNKKVLTVAGSGDQRINAFMLGASKVTCFDINPLTKLQINLKDAALKIVNYEKFIKFFGVHTSRYGNYYEFLDRKVFNEFKNKLDDDTYEFYNYLINGTNYINYYDIYQGFNNNLDLLTKMDNYLTPDSFDNAKRIMNNKTINFIESDLKTLSSKLGNEKYDLILLSNISDYIHLMYEENPLYYYRELIDELTDHLNKYGIIQVGYIYSSYHKNSNTSKFRLNDERYKYFPTNTFHSVLVDSYDNNGSKDKIITYRKLN